jgi:hypothetical protein
MTTTKQQPTTSYSNWCQALSAMAAAYNVNVAYGAETYDAWARGATAESYAQTCPAVTGWFANCATTRPWVRGPYRAA